MGRIEVTELPTHSLLRRYASAGAGSDGGHYTDCFVADLPAPVDLAQYVAAFYTTPLFRLERIILRWLAKRPSTDDEARAVALGERDSFAAWTVEQRTADQLLLQDMTGRTRSWFMASPRQTGADGGTTLYFGSAVLARAGRTASTRQGLPPSILILLHRAYSRALLWSASRRLSAGGGRS